MTRQATSVMCAICAIGVSAAACVTDDARIPAPAGEPRLATTVGAIANGKYERARDNVVLVHIVGGDDLCTGTLVSDRVVLTAKHCVQAAGEAAPIASDALVVLTGFSPFQEPTGTYEVESIATTPGVYQNLYELEGSDLALVTLTKAPSLAPLRMKLTPPADEQGKVATAVGYGDSLDAAYNGIKFSRTVLVGEVSKHTIRLDETACGGDSGGPFINGNEEVFGVVSFGPNLPCGEGPTYYQRIDMWRELILDTIAKSQRCDGPGVEACDGFDNDCDGRVDEDCALEGAPCKADADCLALLCVEGGEGKVCANRCNLTAPVGACNEGFVCSEMAPCEGACLKRETGSKLFGEICARDSDCQSLSCVQASDATRRCSVACRGGQGNCLSGEACAADATTLECGACFEVALVAGELAQDEPCSADSQCSTGHCFDDGGSQYCARACVADVECDASHHCRDQVCVRGGRSRLGGVCAATADCQRATFCGKTPGGDFCTRTCDGDAACGDGFSCLEGANGKVCASSLSTLGGACKNDEECVSGDCHGPSMTCTAPCSEASACGAGLECKRVRTGGGLCLASTVTSVDPDPDAGPEPDPDPVLDVPEARDKSGSCSASPMPERLLWHPLWILMGVACARRKRREHAYQA